MKAVISLDDFIRNLSDIVSPAMYGDQRKRFILKLNGISFFKLVDAIKARMSEKNHAELQKINEGEVNAVRDEEINTSIKQEH